MTDIARRRLVVHRDEVPRLELNFKPGDSGSYWEMISGDLNGSTDLQVGWCVMEPGQRHLVHHHTDASEFYLVVSGSGSFTIGDQEVQAGPKTALYMPVNVRHGIWNNTDEPMELVYGFSVPNYRDAGTVFEE